MGWFQRQVKDGLVGWIGGPRALELEDGELDRARIDPWKPAALGNCSGPNFIAANQQRSTRHHQASPSAGLMLIVPSNMHKPQSSHF